MITETIRRLESITPLLLTIYKSCGVTNFPFDCFSLLCQCGFDLRQYRNLPEEKRSRLLKVSPDAAIIGNSIFYNESVRNKQRLRFSLVHEMGHNLLNSENEDDADSFASFLLAPPQLINAWGLRTADEIASRFDISVSAANRALYVARKMPTYHKQSDEDLELLKWFGIENMPVVDIVSEKKVPKRLPPLLSKEEKAKWTPEQQKKIASIRRRRRKIERQMDGVEGDIADKFNLEEDYVEYLRLYCT